MYTCNNLHSTTYLLPSKSELQTKNTIRDRGRIATKTAYTVYTADTAYHAQGCINCGILLSGIRARGEHGDVFLFSNLIVL